MQGLDASVLAAEQARNLLPVGAVGRAAARRPAVALALQVHLRDSNPSLAFESLPCTLLCWASGAPETTSSNAVMSLRGCRCARF